MEEEKGKKIPYLDWKKYDLPLLREVAASGVYLLQQKEAGKAWRELVQKFCTRNHPELKDYWIPSRKDCHRRFYDRFWLVYKQVRKWIGNPKSNKSTKSVDYHQIVEEVEELKRALDEQEAEKSLKKKDKKKQKARPEEITDAAMVIDRDDEDHDFQDHVLPNKKMAKKDHKKSEEGPWGREDRSRAKKDQVDDEDEDVETSAIKHNAFGKSENWDEAVKAEPKMQEFARDKTIDDIFSEANVRENPFLRRVLEEIGVELLVNLYCTKQQDFCPIKFKDQMKEMGLPPIAAHQVYFMLTKWRKKSHEVNVSAPSTATSSESSSAHAFLPFPNASTPINFHFLDPQSGELAHHDGTV